MLEPQRSRRSRWGRAVAFVTVVMAFPAMSAASLSSLSSIPIPVPALTLGIVELVPGDGCPSNMARVGANCIDKYEASLVAMDEDGKESTWSPYDAPNGHAVRAVSRKGVVPQAHISMVEAKRACSASGKRLCRADEWKTACKGPEHTRYPYGDTRVPNACVDTNRTSPMKVLHEGEHSAQTMNDPLANQQENTLEPTGSAASCTNGYGVHDMVGNVHEWTDDGSFRGGYYLDTSENGEGCEYRTTAHAPAYYDYSTGFRCCADADSIDEDADDT
jgi:formylglycine-generating enzyme